MFHIILILVTFFESATYASFLSPIVETSSGLVEGRYVTNIPIPEKPYFAFQGIPYAESPVGKLRFQPPKEPKNWKNVYQAKTEGSKCVQKMGGSEDCLYLNVYTPNIPTDNNTIELMPVMVYVHGGAFLKGSARISRYGPEFLMEKNVVLVSFNYRLNLFGFLNVLDEAAPGNMGLKDQLAVLRWVKKNIINFGGNPDKVTIFGHSAGAGSVLYLLQAESAKGLFHGVIAQSGSVINPWAIQKHPKELAIKLATHFECNNENMTALVNCLQNISAEELFQGYHGVQPPLKFLPSIEKNSSDAFFTTSAFELLNENKIPSVPCIIGYVTNEANIFVRDGTLQVETFITNPKLLVPTSLNVENDSNIQDIIVNEILKMYFQNESIPYRTLYANYKTQDVMLRGIRKTVELLRSNQDIYFYVYTHNDGGFADLPGPTHSDELPYIFYNGTSETSSGKILRQKLTTLWTNFAKTGNPTPKEEEILDKIIWPKLTKTREEATDYLEINNVLKTDRNPSQKDYIFWENLFNKYGKMPFYTW